MLQVTAKEARDKFSDCLNRAAFGKEPVVVTKNGKPVMAMVPIEDLEALKESRFRAAMERVGDRYEQVFDRLAK